jgi:hypothetical protein
MATSNPFKALDKLGLGEDPEKAPTVEKSAFTKTLDGKHPRTIAVVNYKGASKDCVRQRHCRSREADATDPSE